MKEKRGPPRFLSRSFSNARLASQKRRISCSRAGRSGTPGTGLYTQLLGNYFTKQQTTRKARDHRAGRALVGGAARSEGSTGPKNASIWTTGQGRGPWRRISPRVRGRY